MYFGDNGSHGSVENRGVPRSTKLGGHGVIRFNGGTVVALRKYLKRMVPDLLDYDKKCVQVNCIGKFARHCGSREDNPCKVAPPPLWRLVTLTSTLVR